MKRPTAAPSNAFLIVKPKDLSQNSEATIIRTKNTPTKLKVRNVIRHTANGGIALDFGSKEAAQNIRKNAESVLE